MKEMFKVNEYVIYSTNGVCKIEAISKREVCGEAQNYYVLNPVFDEKCKFFVPVDNNRLTSKMHKVLSSKEVYELIKSIPSEENIWIENENDRKEKYKQILENGDREKIMRIIKTLQVRRKERVKNNKKLRLVDEKLLGDAEKFLYEEFAYVLNINCDQVLPFITQQIKIEKE
ncbi:MAG: CarD family transcriptional regulator [Bacillota bacterium]|nr:CarD family transcriptional regulator [Bacillota bacterium]